MQTIKLDIAQKNNVPLLYVKQRDVGHVFAIELYENGVPYEGIEENNFAVWFSGASGDGNYTEIGDATAVSVDGNLVEVQMIMQMLNEPGDHEMCVVMYGQGGNVQKGFWNIPYFVEAIPGADSEGATEYYQAFLDAQKKAEEAADRAEDAADRAEGAAAKINVDQEYIDIQVFSAGQSAEIAATAARDAQAAASRAEAAVDNIEPALDGIIAIQNELIGGAGA